MANSQILGITGGIGAGKSFVAGIFNHLGIPVYNSDIQAKQILATHPEVKSELKQHFGNQILLKTGEVDRKALASIVFNDSQKLKQLNAIIHPRVAEDFKMWVDQNEHNPWLIKEAAILIESGAHKSCDKILLVSASQQVRLARVMERDGAAKQEVLDRMANQMQDEERRKYADMEITNDGNSPLLPQINKVLTILNWRNNNPS